MKKVTLSLALLSVALLAFDSSAQGQGRKPGKKGGNAEKSANRGPAGRGGPAAERDPAQMVARMMKEFDKDGDQKLDSSELTALLASMRERRGGAMRSGGPGQAGQGKPGEGRPGQRKSKSDGKRRRSGDTDNANPGGERPKRPVDA